MFQPCLRVKRLWNVWLVVPQTPQNQKVETHMWTFSGPRSSIFVRRPKQTQKTLGGGTLLQLLLQNRCHQFWEFGEKAFSFSGELYSWLRPVRFHCFAKVPWRSLPDGTENCTYNKTPEMRNMHRLRHSKLDLVCLILNFNSTLWDWGTWQNPQPMKSSLSAQ